MTRRTLFTISGEVRTSDGTRGSLERVAVDPASRVLTHLVVSLAGKRDRARLVPIDLVERAAPVIELSCTAEQFDRLEAAQAEEVVNPPADLWAGSTGARAMPAVGAGAGVGGGVHGGGPVRGPRTAKPRVVKHEVVPDGEVDVRKGERVHATDGDIGKVNGLIADPETHHVTHVLLDEGHLWGSKTVAIPIGNVRSVDDGVRLDLTKQQVKDLPPVDAEALVDSAAAPQSQG
jgi:sporulation protein YlmC with PRC-barrel domain